MNPFEILLWSSAGLLAFFYFTYYVLMVYYAKKPNNVRKQRIFPKVSLVIPTYNEETTILRKLENTEKLDYPKEKLEVIIVDSASTDKTIETVAEFNKNNENLNLRLITQTERRGKANALNYVLPHCTSEIVVISDADSLLEKNSLTQIITNFADPTVGAVSGRQILLNPHQSLASKIEKNYRGIYEILRIGESHMDSTPIFHGELSAFRRKLVKGISEDSLADDSEISINVRKRGHRAIYDPVAIFYEYAPPTLKARMKQKQRRGQGLIQVFLRNVHLMFKEKYGRYGSIILPCEIFMHVISPILITLIVALTAIAIAFNSISFVSLTFLIIILLMVASLSLVSKIMPSAKINLAATIFSFLNTQICLILSLFALFIRKTTYGWEKIEDVRVLWEKENNYIEQDEKG